MISAMAWLCSERLTMRSAMNPMRSSMPRMPPIASSTESWPFLATCTEFEALS